MNKITAIISGITIPGVFFWALRYVVKSGIRNNPEKAIEFIVDGIGFIAIQTFNVLEWMIGVLL